MQLLNCNEENEISIQHRDIGDGDRHEPKGASTAVANSTYTANGSGSGVWQKIKSLMFQGVVGDGGNANSKLITDGSNGFVLRRDAVYGQQTITNNTNGFTVAAAADSTLNTNSDYALFTGTGAPWAAGLLNECTFTTDRITVPVTGVYTVDVWSNITSYPSNTAFIAMKYRVNGTTFGPRKVKSKSNSAGDAGNLVGFGMAQFNAGDFIQLMFASSVAGNLVIGDMNMIITLKRQTA